MTSFAIIAVVVAVVSLLKVRIEQLPVTEPMLFVAIGFLASSDVTGILDLSIENETVALAAELTLALLLFTDAARINPMSLRESLGLPVRLLGIGLPLTLVLGTVGTWLILPSLSWAEAALIAAVLTPTDAALGEAVVTNPAVPIRIRQALNVESGLNDGMVVPVVAVFAALAVGMEVEGPRTVLTEALADVMIGVVAGVGIGFVLSRVIPAVVARHWTDDRGLRLVALGAAAAAFAGSSAAGGNGFIAAFACGLAVRTLLGSDAPERVVLAEDVGQVGAAVVFILFGAVLVNPALDVISWPIVACALGTLTLARMIPVWIATRGAGLKTPTVAFLGWFGPRGLASMVFGLLIVGDGEISEPDDFLGVIVVVITLSILLHGISAAPLAKRYGAWFERHGNKPLMAEAMMVEEARSRRS